jgi:hypothetical protein
MRRFALPLILGFLFLLFSTPVFASTPNPDSGPFITSYFAYENTQQVGDILVLVEYDIPYASLPSTTATQNFMLRYLSPTSSVLQTISPFSYNQLGYNYGVAAFYFAPGVLTFGESDSIQLVGNPTISWASGVPSVTVPMMVNNWVASSSTFVGREQVCAQVISLATDLQARWSLSLLATSSTGTVLNTTNGQLYFSNVIPYFNTICGAILSTTGAQPVNPPPPTPYATTYQASLQGVWTSSIIGPDIAQTAAAEGINSQEYLFGIFLIISICFLAFVAIKIETPGAVPLLFIPVFVGGIKIGVVPMDLGVGACAILFIISMYFLVYRRAAV